MSDLTKRKPRIGKRQADQAFSKWTRNRDMKCQNCGASGDGAVLQCAHILSRSYLAVRYDPDNAVVLCRSCHVFFTHRPIEWQEWVTERIGQEAWHALRMKALAGPVEKLNYREIVSEFKVNP